MDYYKLGLIIGITLIIISFIIIIIIIVIININHNNDGKCNSQADCSSGQVCSFDITLNYNICKSGLGNPCNTNTVCASGLICLNSRCSNPSFDNVDNTAPSIILTRKNIMSEIPIPLVPIPPPIPISLPPENRQIVKPILEDSSTDYEINSSGRRIDGPFDFRSQESTEINVDTSVSTPCEEKDGLFYCRTGNYSVFDEIDHSAVIDVCSYSSLTMFLLEDTDLIIEDKEDNNRRRKVKNNIALQRICSFVGYLYGLGLDEKLYTLSNNYLSSNYWIWSKSRSSHLPNDTIKHISVTQDDETLWLQTESDGYLYNNDLNKVIKYPALKYIKRVYGRDQNHYLDINTEEHTATVYPQKTKHINVYDAVLSYYDIFMPIYMYEKDKYKRITIVDWDAYYIRNN